MRGNKARSRAADRRERLIASAIKLFSRHSFDEVPVQDIAADADVATGLLYYHFTDKQGLYAAALETLADRLRLAADEAIDPGAPALERLEGGLRAQLKVMAKSPPAYRELLGGVASQPRVRAIVERERRARLDLVVEALPPDVPGNPTLMATLEGWLHFADGVQLAWLKSRDIPLEEIAELCVRVLMASVEAARELNGSARAG